MSLWVKTLQGFAGLGTIAITPLTLANINKGTKLQEIMPPPQQI